MTVPDTAWRIQFPCPVCKAPVGVRCTTASGRPEWPGHKHRGTYRTPYDVMHKLPLDNA